VDEFPWPVVCYTDASTFDSVVEKCGCCVACEEGERVDHLWYRTHWQKTIVKDTDLNVEYTIYWPSGFSSRAHILDQQSNLPIAELDRARVKGTETMKLLEEALTLGSSWPYMMPPEKHTKDDTVTDVLEFKSGDRPGIQVPIHYKQGYKRLSYLPLPVVRSARLQGLPAPVTTGVVSRKRAHSKASAPALQAKRRPTASEFDDSNSLASRESTDDYDTE
jgi:hypothetical protein